jgi:tetratricopeptide (TPR) repeat protein
MTEVVLSLPFFRSTLYVLSNTALTAVTTFKSFGQESAVPLLIEGQLAFETKNFSESAALYARALAMDPQSQKAACGLAKSTLAMNQPLEAQKALEPILGSSSDLTMDFKETYGLSLYNNNYVVDAEPWLSMVASADPTRTTVLIPLAQAAMLSRNYAEAWKYLDRASKIGSRDRTWLVLKSQYALENSRQADAERFARSAVQYYPKDPVAIASLIVALQKSRDDARHLEAIDLANAVLERASIGDTGLTPLEYARRAQSKNVALQYLISENSTRQNWADAAKYLQIAPYVPLDNALVSSILRKSPNAVAAILFATKWYLQDPTSEQAIEAYLRSLAMATGGLLVSAQRTSDAPTGLGLPLSAAGLNSATSESSDMLNLVVTFIAAPFSKELKSFLYYMSASLQKDKNTAIEQLKNSLAERADNVEALVSLSSLYLERYQSQIDKSDTLNRDKAMRYLTHAKSLNPTDKDILATIAQLEARLK